MKLNQLLTLFVFFGTCISAQTKQLISSNDSTVAYYTVLNSNIVNSRKVNVTVGGVFAEIRYFNYNKFVVGIVASAFSGLRADFSYCYKTSSRKKPALIYLGNAIAVKGMTYNYTNDTIILSKNSCFHTGIIYAPVLMNGGTRLRSLGYMLGLARFKFMVNKYKAKSRDFFLTAEKSYRKSIHIDLLYFPSFNFDRPTGNDRILVPTKEKNVFGIYMGYNGSSLRRRDPRTFAGGPGWRAGFGVTFNGQFFLDIGLGFSF